MKKYECYVRKINYYETDKMQVVHHSNYARYLEESRIDMMAHYGIPFEEIEERGLMIPVLELKGKFRESIKFGDTIKIVPKVEKITPVKFYISYEIYDENMTSLKHTAETVHCFLDMNFKPVALRKVAPDLYERFIVMKDGIR